MRTALLVIFAILCLLGALTWGMVILYVVGMGHLNLATSGQGGTSNAEAIVLLLPVVYVLFLFVASFRFVPLWLAVAMLALADTLLLFFAIEACRVAKMTGLKCSLPFFALGIAGHWLLWSDKRRMRRAKEPALAERGDRT